MILLHRAGGTSNSNVSSLAVSSAVTNESHSWALSQSLQLGVYCNEIPQAAGGTSLRLARGHR